MVISDVRGLRLRLSVMPELDYSAPVACTVACAA